MNQVETFIYLLAYLRGEEPCHTSDSAIAHSFWPYFCSSVAAFSLFLSVSTYSHVPHDKQAISNILPHLRIITARFHWHLKLTRARSITVSDSFLIQMRIPFI